MSAYVVDTETTGEEPVPEVIELGVLQVEASTTAEQVLLHTTPVFQGRYNPQGRIKFSAMAVHHILPQELLNERHSALAKTDLPPDMEFMIGHNVDYDWNALGNPACKRICTLAIARRIWPGNDGHSLTAMSYQLATDLFSMRDALKDAHSAGADAELCALVLAAMWETPMMAGIDSWDKLHAFSEDCRIPRYWTFGKYRGHKINETDRGYLLWCARQADMDAYVRQACQLSLKGQLTE